MRSGVGRCRAATLQLAPQSQLLINRKAAQSIGWLKGPSEIIACCTCCKARARDAPRTALTTRNGAIRRL